MKGSFAAPFTEIKNKCWVYALVRTNELILGIPRKLPHPFPLEEYLPRAMERDDYARLFALEGLGRLYGCSQLFAGVEPKGILEPGVAPAYPDSIRLVLHAGLGLAFGKVTFDQLAPKPTLDEVGAAVTKIFERCRANALDGFLPASLEALGLVVGVFHRQLQEPVLKALHEQEPEALPLFWHGMGRALYFTPSSMAPGSTWKIVKKAQQIGRDDPMIRNNLISGLSAALTMVNISSPEVLARMVIGPHGADLLDEPGFIHGVASSIIMREITTPNADFVRRFCDLDPPIEYWNELVRQPSRRAIDVYAPALLQNSNRLAEICEFGDLEETIHE